MTLHTPLMEAPGKGLPAGYIDTLAMLERLHRLLLDAGEIALRANRPDDAFRAFGQVLLHADDKVLLNQAHVGAWFAMTELAEPIDALEEMLTRARNAEKLKAIADGVARLREIMQSGDDTLSEKAVREMHGITAGLVKSITTKG